MPYLMRCAGSLWLLFFGILPSQTPPPPVPPTPTFADIVRPFLEAHCQSCHNRKTRLGEINFEVLKYATGVADQPGIRETTANVLKTGRMTPPGVPRPPEAEVTAARAFIETGLAHIGERSKTFQLPATNEWLTWQVDPERTGWARGETPLKNSNAEKLELKWKAQLDAAPTRVNGYSTLTDPLVAEGIRTARRRFPNTAKSPTPTSTKFSFVRQDVQDGVLLVNHRCGVEIVGSVIQATVRVIVFRPARPPGARRRLGGGPENQVNPSEPGAERDAAWLTSQNEPGGQAPGRRYSGGRDVTHAVLYALDAANGKQIYSSKDVIDSWNHYGGIALAGGRIYLSTYDARVFAFGLPRQ